MIIPTSLKGTSKIYTKQTAIVFWINTEKECKRVQPNYYSFPTAILAEYCPLTIY